MPLNKQEIGYREHLVDARQKAQADYDKTIVLFAGGALGLSVTFIADIVGEKTPTCPGILLWGWSLLVGSLVGILCSFYASRSGLTKAITRLDAGRDVRSSNAWVVITELLNILSALLLVGGVGFLLYFVALNLGGK